ncbi:MAG: hypothetical protein V2I76_15200 [Roseobacter sp.]|jgi:hypothetical protein|nr:hypothetical protein [Roseobacter sp.]
MTRRSYALLAAIFVSMMFGSSVTGQALLDRVDQDYQSTFDDMDARAEIMASEGMVSRLETSWFPVDRCEQLTVDSGNGTPLYLFGSRDNEGTPVDLACSIETRGHRVTGIADIGWGPDFNDRARFIRVRLAGGSTIVIDAQRFSSASSETAKAYVGSYQRVWHAETGAVVSFGRQVDRRIADTIDAPLPAFLLGRASMDLTRIGLNAEGGQLEGGAGNPITPRVIQSALVDLVQGYYSSAEPTRSGVAWLDPLSGSPVGYTSVSVRGVSCEQDGIDAAQCAFEIGIVHSTHIVDVGSPGSDPRLAIFEPFLNNRMSRWTLASADLRFLERRWHAAIDRANFAEAVRPSDARFSINTSGTSPYDCVSHSLVLGPAIASGFGC